MSQPMGWNHRHERSLRGLLARWWIRRRTRLIKRARDQG